jgi:hypothetical protein
MPADKVRALEAATDEEEENMPPGTKKSVFSSTKRSGMTSVGLKKTLNVSNKQALDLAKRVLKRTKDSKHSTLLARKPILKPCKAKQKPK